MRTVSKTSYSLEFLAESYIADLASRNSSEHTLQGFTRVLHRFRNYVQETGRPTTQNAICPETIRTFQSDLYRKKYKASSVRFYTQVLKAWSAHLCTEGVFRSDPLAGRGLLPRIPKMLPKNV